MVTNRMHSLTAIATALLLLAGSVGSAQRAPAAHPVASTETLVYGTTQEPDTLNPQMTVEYASVEILVGVFDSLVKVDQQNNFIPDLATRWSVSPDSLTYTFHLRHGVRWADGAPFTAQDVAFTYQQIRNPKNNNTSTQGWDHVTRMETPDAYTVILHTRSVYAPLLLQVGRTAILPAHYFARSAAFVREGTYNHDPFNRRPFGTGPYVVTDWASGDHITLVPNRYYWGQRPSLQTVVVKFVPSANTLLLQLRTNEVQLGAISQQQVQQARSIPGKVLIQAPSQIWYQVELKQWGFLREQPVRVALDYATPKDAIVQHVLHGYAQPAYGDIPPLSWAYDPKVPRHPFDLARARAILAADGFTKGADGYLWKGGQELALQLWYINGSAADEQTNEILKFYWSQIGVKVDLQHEDRSAIWGPGGPQFTRRMTGISTTTTNTDDPDDRFFWNSAEIPRCPTCAGGNWIAYFHPFSFQKHIDALTNAAVATLDRRKRKVLYAQIETLLATQVPMIFLDWVPFLYVRPVTLHGFSPYAFMYGLFWNIEQWHWTATA